MPDPDSRHEQIDWVEGQPYSRRFGDVYFSRASGLVESTHVFLAGNDLDRRFARLTPGGSFAIGEIGFGTGLNFLNAWQLFDRRAPAGARLHFVSTELHPLAPEDLARALALWPSLAREAGELRAQYGALPPAFHRFVFDGGRVVLTLLVGDARVTLPRLDGTIDAWFLDGFAPSRNPELWGTSLLEAVARSSRVGTTCATYSVAGLVRRTLVSVGFRVEKTPGFGTKREMLRGTCAEPPRTALCDPWLARPPATTGRDHAVVVGGGLAGTAVAASLAARGTSVTLLERRSTLAAEASGNPQGVFHIRPSPHGTALTDLVLAGAGLGLRETARLLAGREDAWSRCGVLALASDAADAERQERLARLGWPRTFVHAVDAREAAAIAGVDLPGGGLFYPDSGWGSPPMLCEALVRSPRIAVRTLASAVTLRRDDTGTWRVSDAEGHELARAPVVVVCAANDVRRIDLLEHLPLKVIRGQISYVPATPASARLRTVLCGDSYVAPARDGIHCAGATFGIRDEGTDVRTEDHAENLAALERLAPALADAMGTSALDPASLGGRAALRCVAPDYLPVVGPVCDARAFRERYAALSQDARTGFTGDAPWLAGLHVSTAHGSRGLVSTLVAAETVAAVIHDEPMPLPADVVAALSPSRFLARALKRRTAGGGSS
ncbi:MAG: bifunctional tRNA (5-methylaminomethyl-2-thiouridine)(34)-methyltransferase MnmD/FAD-dependent 5-carboxymethylaminomethyl-2-thiouridine(34) oxidoreductase MnmC [Betaproteobacteria bacterium]|nr:bifunctional tRNA (5-methylaminomethyl-2-thiouridine)(34)-methyltransferase MnmD/FAD-dependent 5-carboxymethylaminomethyl-2-thiouridine(34) oxidoreductase MnmC [Betaproteobacteria bacterium]